jgi:hypothetical protein
MLIAGIVLVFLGGLSFVFHFIDPGLLAPALPDGGFLVAGAVFALGGIALIAFRRPPTKVFDSELDAMSEDEVLRTTHEIESIKKGNNDTLYGLVEEAPTADTKADLDEIVDRYSQKLAVSRHTVMTILKYSQRVKKIKE